MQSCVWTGHGFLDLSEPGVVGSKCRVKGKVEKPSKVDNVEKVIPLIIRKGKMDGGMYGFRLTVQNDKGEVSAETETITVSTPPSPGILYSFFPLMHNYEI